MFLSKRLPNLPDITSRPPHKMDSPSIDQVIQATRENAEYSQRKHSNSTSSHDTVSKSSQAAAYKVALNRKPSMVDSRAPPISRSNHPSISTLSSTANTVESYSSRSRSAIPSSGFTDFFGHQTFRMVLRNPTTSHRFLKFCQRRACGENMEFLAQVEHYNRILDDLTKTMSNIQKTYTGPNSEKGINISSQDSRAIHNSIKHSVNNVIPSLECIFLDAEEHIEGLLMKDVYPRFVKHQVTTSATLALGAEGSRVGTYQGAGDCFCLTDPSKPDNPIVSASDGFVDVTGYTRKEIVPRNCRFLQGQLTDRCAVKRLKSAIEGGQEIVELILNYRKNGDPFWNLLYVSPLYDHNDKLAFFLGGQINCSTTIHSCTDILRILSLPEEDDGSSISDRRPSPVHSDGRNSVASGSTTIPSKNRSSFFKSFVGWGNEVGRENLNVMSDPGMEGNLTQQFQKTGMGIDGQLDAFYTAYSKYLILRISPHTSDLMIEYYSPSMLEFIILPQITYQAQHSNPLSSRQSPSSLTLFNRDIFKVLSDNPLSASIGKGFKSTVKDCIKNGKAVSIEMGMMTGIETVQKGGRPGSRRVEEKYLTHWTVMKDEEGRGKWVVFTIAPK